MQRSLSMQQRISAIPGVLDIHVQRDVRGAVLKIEVWVAQDVVRTKVIEALASALGPRFVTERAEVHLLERQSPNNGSNGAIKEPGTVGQGNLAVHHAGESRRIQLIQVSSTLHDGQTLVEVTLDLNGETVTCGQEGPSIAGAPLRLAATATIEAINKVWEPIEAMIEDVTTAAVGGESVVVVALAANLSDGWHRLHGASGTRDGAPEAAAVRAVLSALNRPVAN
jgi:hypothetical protein